MNHDLSNIASCLPVPCTCLIGRMLGKFHRGLGSDFEKAVRQDTHLYDELIMLALQAQPTEVSSNMSDPILKKCGRLLIVVLHTAIRRNRRTRSTRENGKKSSQWSCGQEATKNQVLCARYCSTRKWG